MTRVGTRAATGFVRLRDAMSREHEIRWEPHTPTTRAFVRGRRLAMGYAPIEHGAELPLDVYRALMARALEHEAELAALCTDVAQSARPTTFVTEGSLWRSIAAEMPTARSVTTAVERWLDRTVPREARGDLILYFDAPCDQACEFCEDPQRRSEPSKRATRQVVRLRQLSPLDLVASGAFDALLASLSRRAEAPRLTLMGNDWLAHRRLDEILAALERSRGLHLRCYGPSTRLADPPLARRVAQLPGLESIGLTLQSSDPATHDRIVGAHGAGSRVQRAIDLLGGLGAPLEITLVLTRAALPTLAETVRWVFDRGHRIALQCFIPDRGFRGAGAIHASSDEIAAALTSIDAEALTAVTSVVGGPWCGVPESLRGRIVSPLVAAIREPLVHPAPCSGCSVRAKCPGVPVSYVETFGPRGVTPLSRE